MADPERFKQQSPRQQQQQGNERTEYLFNIKNSKPGHIKIENNTRILSLAPQTNFYNKNKSKTP